jgi:8-oxo-dGTP diphosphatase
VKLRLNITWCHFNTLLKYKEVLILHQIMGKIHQINHRISTDCVIFGFDSNRLEVLLIERKYLDNRVFARALPGDLIYDDEDFDDAAKRVLEELTGLKDIFLEQVGAFGSTERLDKPEDRIWLEAFREFPNERVVTVGYYSLVKKSEYVPRAASFAKEAVWVPVEDVEELAYDHFDIFQKALAKLRADLKLRPIGFDLLPDKFIISDLHKLYESILGKPLDKRNFRRKINNLGLVESLNEKQTNVPHKPSVYFRFNQENYEKLARDGFDNFNF